MTRMTRFILAAMLAWLCLFWLYPQLDLKAAALFYDPEIDAFSYSWRFFLSGISKNIGYAAVVIVLAPLAISIYRHYQGQPAYWCRVAYVALCLALGGGLVVNAILKENFGRARPKQVEQLGGEDKFYPPAIIVNECPSNCSFSAGDPTVPFTLFAYGFIWQRRRWFAIAGGLGLAMGLVRMAQGAHFLSDVLFSGMAVYLVCAGTNAIFKRYGLQLFTANSKNLGKPG